MRKRGVPPCASTDSLSVFTMKEMTIKIIVDFHDSHLTIVFIIMGWQSTTFQTNSKRKFTLEAITTFPNCVPKRIGLFKAIYLQIYLKTLEKQKLKTVDNKRKTRVSFS